jgi:RimJ/RimL family protein N-acetyltransferase
VNDLSEFATNSIVEHYLRFGFIFELSFWSGEQVAKHSYVLEESQSGQIVGMTTLTHYIRNNYWQIGYAIAPEQRTRGYAAEAIAAMIRRLRAADSGAVFRARTLRSNTASIQLLQKMGFRQIDWPVDYTYLSRSDILFELRPEK